MEASLLKARLSRRSRRPIQHGSGPLHSLIQVAYDVTRFQVEGGPSWVRTDRYAIEARAAGNATPDQMRGDAPVVARRPVQAHPPSGNTNMPVYELVVADGGLKIAAMKEGECIAKKEMRWDLIDLEAPLYICDSARRRVLSQSPETRPRPRWPRVTRIEAGGISMSALIDFISVDVDRVVIDRTGFTAPFNLASGLCSCDAAGIPVHLVWPVDLRGVGRATGSAAATRRGATGCARD